MNSRSLVFRSQVPTPRDQWGPVAATRGYDGGHGLWTAWFQSVVAAAELGSQELRSAMDGLLLYVLGRLHDRRMVHRPVMGAPDEMKGDGVPDDFGKPILMQAAVLRGLDGVMQIILNALPDALG